MKLLKCDYCNWGQLDKVNQSVYRKITIHSKKVGYGPISRSINSSYSKRKIEILIANKTRKQSISRDNVFLFETYNTQETYLSDTSCYFVIYQQFLCCHYNALQ